MSHQQGEQLSLPTSTPSGCNSVEQSRPLKSLAYNKLSTIETARESEEKNKDITKKKGQQLLNWQEAGETAQQVLVSSLTS